ncbi:MAG: NAD(P)H-quinone oxidoreductase subunit L [Cyanobacteria bacterium J06634_6]
MTFAALKMPALGTPALLAIGLYATFAVLYLVVIPAALMYYLKARWNVAGSVERLIFYGLILVFFPGCLVLSPFLNFRPKRREI